MKDMSTPQNNLLDLSQVTTYQSGIVQSSAYRRLDQHFTRLLKQYQLSPMQWFVLGTIYDTRDAGIRLTELAEKVGTGLPFITNLVNLLESRDLVERVKHKQDSRSKLITSTQKFRKLCPEIEADLRMQLRESIYATISPAELRTYIGVLYKLQQLD